MGTQQAEARVAICVPVGRHPTYPFWESERTLRGGAELLTVRERPIPEARRLLTERALATSATHLLFIDDDMVFPPDALERLLKHDKDIVGALCHNRRAPYNPTLGQREGASTSYSFVYDYPADALIEVDATGAAFLLVRRAVFQKTHDWWEPISVLGEDFSFCLRAKEAGFQVLVDTSLDIGHVAEVVVNRETAGRLRGPRAPTTLGSWRPKPGAAFLPGVPRATIVIPTFNQRPELLRAAVASALGQTVPVEVVVVDDGTAGSIAVPSGARVIVHTTNRGIAEALNTGISSMTTEWFCWLSSDDTLAPTKVAVQLADMERVGAKVGFHDYDVGGRVGHTPPTWRNLDEQRATLARDCVINGSTVMIHRSVFDAVGRFDPEYHYGQDWEFWCRAGEKYLWHLTPLVLGARNEGGNLTAAIAAEPPDGPRRKRRNEEDAKIRATYSAARQCRACGAPQ